MDTEKILFLINTYGRTCVSADIPNTEHVIFFKPWREYDFSKYINFEVCIMDVNDEDIYVPLDEFDISWAGRLKTMVKVLGKNYVDFAKLSGYAHTSIKQLASRPDDQFPETMKATIRVFEAMYRKHVTL